MEEYSYTSTNPLGHTGLLTIILYLYLCAKDIPYTVLIKIEPGSSEMLRS